MIRFLAPQVKASHRVLTLDFAGSGGTLANNATIDLTVRDENLRAVRSITTVVNGVGSSATVLALTNLSAIFPDYNGQTDAVGVVLTPTGAVTWDTNGVGPRILRYRSDYTAQNDCHCFRNASGTDRVLGANITGASAGTYVGSGVFDARAIGAVFTRGATVSGWTDTAPTQGVQLSPTATQELRATAIVATQTEAALLGLGTGDVLALGLGSIVGALTGAASQSASGLTFDLASCAITFRYAYVHIMKGQE